jgi:hypothetical protein
MTKFLFAVAFLSFFVVIPAIKVLSAIASMGAY